jgi:hypothetical protein
MKVYWKKPITLCGQHVNATHRGTQVFDPRYLEPQERYWPGIGETEVRRVER